MSGGRGALVAVVLLAGVTARAEAGWLTSRGLAREETRLEAWGGPRSVGLGILRRGVGVEVTWILPDRVAAVRVGQQWTLARRGIAAASATLGAAGWVVPSPAVDVGLGPHGTLALTLGGERFAVDLAMMTGVELFVRQQAPRLPQRLQLGVSLRLGDWSGAVMARIGADVLPGHGFVGRGEVVLSLSWFGLARPRTD